GGARRGPEGLVVLRGAAAGGRGGVRGGRRAARGRGRGVPAHGDDAQRAGGLPAADLALAGVRFGAERHLDGAVAVHAAPPGERGAAGPLGPVGRGGCGTGEGVISSRTSPAGGLG